MTTKLRFVPEGGALVEVTCRTVESRFLLKPSPELESLTLGILARAYVEYPVELVGVSSWPSSWMRRKIYATESKTRASRRVASLRACPTWARRAYRPTRATDLRRIPTAG